MTAAANMLPFFQRAEALTRADVGQPLLELLGDMWKACLVDTEVEQVFRIIMKVTGATRGALDRLWAEVTGRRRPRRRNLSVVSMPGVATDDEIVLDPNDPMAIAHRFIAHAYTADDLRTLHVVGGDPHAWCGSNYDLIAAADLRSKIYAYLEKAKRQVQTDEGSELQPFKPKKSKVDDVLDALLAICHQPAVREPEWLTPTVGVPAHELLACKSGLLHIPTRKLLAHTPGFFNVNAVPFAYDASAAKPEKFLAFLQSIWATDLEAIATLQEIFGYLLTGDTSQQKIFLLVGPKRSGKGTLGRILTALLGAANVCAPTLSGLASNFGAEPLIRKRLALISDARLGGANQAVIAERLLSISGEDSITIDRKHVAAWTGRLSVRFVILTNELPRIADASAALPNRFIVLTLRQSFFGREDAHLTESLLGELPGILNWSLDGLERLLARGRFLVPASSEAAVQKLEDLASPISAFVRERCVLHPGAEIRRGALFDEWKRWCEQNGRDRPGTLEGFGRDLYAAFPSEIGERRPRVDGERPWFYTGIGLVQAGHGDQAMHTRETEENTHREYEENKEHNGRSYGPPWTAGHFEDVELPLDGGDA